MTQIIRILADHIEIRGLRHNGERSEPTLAQTDYRHAVLNMFAMVHRPDPGMSDSHQGGLEYLCKSFKSASSVSYK